MGDHSDLVAVESNSPNSASTFEPITRTRFGDKDALDASNLRNVVCTASTITRISISASNVTLLAANSARNLVILVNDTKRDCFVKYGAVATSTNFTIKMEPDDTHIISDPIYTGIIDAIWASASGGGAMQVTEC